MCIRDRGSFTQQQLNAYMQFTEAREQLNEYEKQLEDVYKRQLLFFVIPIRVKYFGFFAAALWVFSFLSAPLAGKLSYLLSMLNVWAFFGPMAYRSVRAWKMCIRDRNWVTT